MFENIFINIGNVHVVEKYFTKSCSEGPNNRFDEHIQEKLTLYLTEHDFSCPVFPTHLLYLELIYFEFVYTCTCI